MNFRIILLVLCVSNTACAELPPVVDTSGGAPANPVASTPNPSSSLTTTYEMMKRIDQMQAEVQQLTGKVEEQAFQIEELKKQQKTMYTDFDDRIQGIENKSGSAQPVETPAETATPPDTSLDSTTPPPPAVKEQPTSSIEPKEVSSDSVTSSAPPQATPEKSSETALAQVPENEKQEYQLAYDDLRNGRTDRAIAGFNTYITSHPGSAYASNAQYWLGEAHRVNMDNASARKAFNAVVDTYPNSAKVPDSLLKLGYIEIEEKNSAKAREILTRVSTEFPSTKAAALAQKKLLTLEKTAP